MLHRTGGENEKLVGKAIAKFGRDKMYLATKFGFIQDKTTGLMAGLDSSPANVRKVCEQSLAYLQTDHIDLFYQHRPDPKTPIEETVAELAKLINEGKIKQYGLSEADPDLIRRAHAVHPVGAVQSELSLWVTDPLDNGVIATCRELGIPFVPFSPLGRGLLAGGIKSAADVPSSDFRANIPRFRGENLDRNLEILARFTKFAESKNATPAQLALAWVLHQGDDIFPLFATRSVGRLDENVAACQIKLSEAELKEITEMWKETAGSRQFVPQQNH